MTNETDPANWNAAEKQAAGCYDERSRCSACDVLIDGGDMCADCAAPVAGCNCGCNEKKGAA
jgi:hypothetical protein